MTPVLSILLPTSIFKATVPA